MSRFFYSDDSRYCVFPWFIPFSLLNSIPLLPFSELVLVVHWCLAILCGREPGSWEFQDLPYGYLHRELIFILIPTSEIPEKGSD